MTQLQEPSWTLLYQGVDVTRDLQGQYRNVTYTDYLTGKSDTIELKLEDADGRWRDDWYPAKGDQVHIEIGYRGGPSVSAGTFLLDEFEFSATPDEVSLRGLAAAITLDLRTKRSAAFEAQSLAQVAEKIASNHGLVLFGKIPKRQYERITQSEETDLAFLKRLAEQEGAAVSIRDKSLIFHDIGDLEKAKAVTQIKRKDLLSNRLKDRTRRIYRAAEISYLDPKTKEVFTHIEYAPGIESGDTLMLKDRVENQAQAITRAQTALEQANRSLASGELVVSGNPLLLAGNVIALSDYGRLSGNYLIQKSTHRIDRQSGYKTTLEVRRVP